MASHSRRSVGDGSQPTFTPEPWQRLERLLEAFEDAWLRGERRALEDYLAESGPSKKAQVIAAESPRTTRLYDRTSGRFSLDEIQKFRI